MAFPGPVIPLVEIGPRTETGFSSGAYRCLGEDGRYYFVKSPKLAGAGAVVAEALGAGLAAAMHLPVREASLVFAHEVLISEDTQALGHGAAFGSLELPQSDPLMWASAVGLPFRLRAEVLLFDYWIQNMDRTLGPAGGNPNLLTAANTELVLIDHGNGFDSEFKESTFLSHHAFAECRAYWQDKRCRAAWQRLACDALQRLPAFWEAIPQDWHENKYGDPLHDKTLENVSALLHRFTSAPPAFWAGLLSP